MTSTPRPPIPAAVLASGRGSNFEALARHAQARAGSTGEEHGGEADGGGPHGPLWTPTLVLSDRPEAAVLERASSFGCDAAVIEHDDPDALLDHLERAGIGLVLLAGYLRLIPPEVVHAYPSRILNIHPSLLPAFGGRGMYGRRVHQAVLDSGAPETGVTIHLVDEEYDRGTVLAREKVPVWPDDDADRLAARVLEVEHRLYPRVVDHVARAILDHRVVRPLTENTFVSTRTDSP